MPVTKDYGYAHLVDQVSTGGDTPDHANAYIYLDEAARLALIEALKELPSKFLGLDLIEMYSDTGGVYTLTLSLKEPVCQ